MQVEDGLVNLGPGMAVTVEIKTGSRRIITYLLPPLLRYKQDALRERQPVRSIARPSARRVRGAGRECPAAIGVAAR